MKKIAYIITALALASCVTEPIYNTEHPDKSTINFSTLWSSMHDGESAPNNYVLNVGKDHYGITNVKTTLLLEPSTSEIFLAHNTPTNITIANGVASLNEATRVASDPEPKPGSLYYGRLEVNLTKDKETDVEFAVKRGTAPLTITLNYKPSEVVNITNVVATLSGVAATRNLYTDAVSEEVTLTHYIVIDDTKNQLTLNYNLLGIISDSQVLTLTYTTADNQTKVVKSVISGNLTNFNNQLTAVTLSGDMNLPTDLEQQGSISEWNTIYGGDSSAD